jgi:hypothetical protein
MKPDFLTTSFLEITIVILLIPVILMLISLSLPVVFGQTATTQGLQPLPQDYYVITQPPKGIVVQQQESSSQFNISDIISGLLGGGAASIYAKIRGDRNQKVTQEVAHNQVKIAEVQQESLNLQYENMPQKGNEITNKPIIKQDNVQQIKDKAVETASKA